MSRFLSCDSDEPLSWLSPGTCRLLDRRQREDLFKCEIVNMNVKIAIAALLIFLPPHISAEEPSPTVPSEPDQRLVRDRRPDGAPVIAHVDKDAAWYTNALTGVSPPYPASLRFLEDQGNWYTPFNRPGMKGVYDIRGWHEQP